MNVFIGCSSKDNLDQIYIDSAIQLANYLAKNNYNLICGGYAGLMKTIQEIFIENQKEITIIGVKGYHDDEIKDIRNAYLAPSIKERKNIIIKKADLALFLPGGVGTIDELFTSIESKRAKEHNIPIIIANINNYYTNLINQLNTMYQEGFGCESDKNYYIANSVEDIINYLR